jgi:hypothetical protein
MTVGIPRDGALALFASSIDLIIHLDGGRSGNRISSISHVVAADENVVIEELISPPEDFTLEHIAHLKRALLK